MTLGELGEFGLIDRIRPRFAAAPGTTGIGDDCAVRPLDGGRVELITTDLLIEDIHFLRDRIAPEDLGHKALAVNLSDIAAMGGMPTAAFLSIGLPPSIEVGWIDGFFAGIRSLSEAADCPLLGGDTTKSPGPVAINFAVLGVAERDRVKYRSSARPGDVLAVTGRLGDSAAGLRLLLDRLPADDAIRRSLIDAHHRPVPHLAEGRWLAGRAGVRAMMDVSDGIDSDLRRIMEASGVGATVDLDSLPVSDALRSICRELGWVSAELAAAGGEDYCLLCTVDPRAFAEIEAAFAAEFRRPLRAVGVATGDGALTYLRGGSPVRPGRRGFDHFKS